MMILKYIDDIVKWKSNLIKLFLFSMMGCNSVKVKSQCHFFHRTQKADFSRLQYFYKSSQAEQRSGVCLMEVQYF